MASVSASMAIRLAPSIALSGNAMVMSVLRSQIREMADVELCELAAECAAASEGAASVATSSAANEHLLLIRDLLTELADRLARSRGGR
jgi:hypothetical protein